MIVQLFEFVQRLSWLFQTEIKCRGLKSLKDSKHYQAKLFDFVTLVFEYLCSLSVLPPWPVSPVPVCSDTDIVRVGRALCPHSPPGLATRLQIPEPGTVLGPETRIPPGLAIRGKNTPSLPPPEQNMVNKQQMPQETCDQPLTGRHYPNQEHPPRMLH